MTVTVTVTVNGPNGPGISAGISLCMAVHPNSLANLTPWPKGHTGNRRGRPNSGGSLLEHLDELAAEDEKGDAVYSVGELEAITGDQRSSHTKAMAAQWIILGRTPGFHEKSGKPYCAMLIEMLLDRKVGKPLQSVLVQHTQSDDPETLLAEYHAMIARSPELLSILGDRVPAEALPAVDAPDPIEPV